MNWDKTKQYSIWLEYDGIETEDYLFNGDEIPNEEDLKNYIIDNQIRKLKRVVLNEVEIFYKELGNKK